MDSRVCLLINSLCYGNFKDIFQMTYCRSAMLKYIQVTIYVVEIHECLPIISHRAPNFWIDLKKLF